MWWENPVHQDEKVKQMTMVVMTKHQREAMPDISTPERTLRILDLLKNDSKITKK